jgi:zinc finger MYND domain-containing protein 10
VQSLELSMWSRVEKDGKIFKYIENKWKLIPLNERNQLTKTEGQVWISLYELLLSPNCVSKYDYTDYKKNQILKV